MSPFALAVAVTVLAGAATIVGGWIATHGRLRSGPALAASLAFAAGAMVTVSALEIVPKGAAELTLVPTLALAVVGAVVVFAVQRAVPLTPGVQQTRLRRSGVIVAVVVAAHNLPEGLATFSATMDDPTTGIAIAVAIAIHNVPEGVAVAAPVQAATGSRRKALVYAAGSGLAEPVGGILGYLLLAAVLPEAAFGAVFGLIAGMMVQISVAELLPAAFAVGGRRATWAGALAGALVMVLSLVLLRLG